MAIIKCKMCGGDLFLVEGQSVAECEYCGSRQTVPVADNEKKLTLFARANRLRASCEFDKAAGIYESIVADFPEEAEAYWGLVLCKYGIEYVDDPATGRKIPTCHRSSFDSIMDDTNFEQALENADAVARKVYREEAKQIEEIRKGIIAVSSNEQPYDIFICYKETDENGDRTLDSVLAQDIYDALVGKGYRTFFARITLEDKLGVEYEPYIFAALNSAKIMLAIGTDYEYYNAVWVKNEWSRYLKLMTQDKTKHLIPCYKGIDAYDMPKEFARLQAQDLGKVGAMQDLMRGIEKILPKKNTTVIQERLVVGGGGDNKIASLLDRGNMALEDGDWAKADSFFEDVLNNDSKNAQAYIGKTLAQEKCRTMDAFVRKRKGLYETVKGQNLSLEPNTKHIEEVADQCRIPNYLTAEEIRNLYQFDLYYHSDVAERRQQYQKEESYWANHKLLSRAEKFAMGAVAENLQREKKALLAALSEQVKKAEATEAGHKKSVQERYAQHIAQMDARAMELHREAVIQREQDYRNWIGNVKSSTDVTVLRSAEAFFLAQGDYQKSAALAAHCRKRIADITAEQDRIAAEEMAAAEAEAEQQRILAAKLKKQRAARNKRIAIVSVIFTVLVISVVAVMTTVIIPNGKLKNAQSLIENGDYQAAYDQLMELGEYKNSAELLNKITGHGTYRPSALTVYAGWRKDYSQTFQYNDVGLPSKVIRTSDDNNITNFELIYNYYDSGKIKNCTIYQTDSNYVIAQLDFYDNNLNHLEFGEPYLVERGLADYYYDLSTHIRFYGVSQCTRFDSDGNVKLQKTYSQEGVDNSYAILAQDDIGRVTVTENVGDSFSKGVITEYIYNDDGTIREQKYYSDSSAYNKGDYSNQHTHDYTYTNGRLTKWVLNIDGSANANELYTYDSLGNLIKTEHVEYENTYEWQWKWVPIGDIQTVVDTQEEKIAKMEEQYLTAKDMLAAEEFDEAIAIFTELSSFSKNYKDSKDLLAETENLKRYTTFARLVDSGAYVEAAEYWEAECNEHFTELDYKDISDYYYYAVALSNYFLGNPIYLDGTIVYLEEKVSPGFKNTSEILANLKNTQDSIWGTYEDPTEVSLSSSIATLQFDKDQYQFKLGSTGNDIGTIAWAFEDGKLAYGIGQSNTWNLCFTPDGNKMVVTANDDGSIYTLWLGTYIKNS